jgi:hypothetical protein
MRTYNLELNDTFSSIRYVLIEQLRDSFFKGMHLTKFAPRKAELVVFGGELTIEQFRSNASSVPRVKYIPPMCMTNSSVDRHETFSMHRKEALDMSTKSVLNEPIKLQRTKQVDQNTLESTMGLFKSATWMWNAAKEVR